MAEKTCSIYLKHPTIKGEAKGDYADAINVDGVSFNANRNAAPKENSLWNDSSAVGGQIICTRYADKASSDCYFEACKKPKDGTGAQHDMSLHFVQSSGEEFFTIELVNCQISSYSFSGDSMTEQPVETLTISFHQLKEKHMDGQKRGWNFGDNTEAT